MIQGLLIVTGGLTLLLWLTVMFIWWQKERGTSEPLALDVTTILMGKCARLARRGWYVCGMYLRSVGVWGNRKATHLFLTLFPSAAPAFTKKNELAGLHSGPSSYFLLSISEKEKESSQKRIV